MKTLIYVSVLVLAFCGVKHFCEKKTEKFSILAISSKRPYNQLWETSPVLPQEEKELDSAFEQPFYYFGCGGQSFIFFSQDGHFALKFFKQHFFHVPWWLKIPPIPWLFSSYVQKKKNHRLDKIKRDFGSYHLAYETFKQESGLLYVHLNPTSHLKWKAHIVDKIGIRHILDLNQFDFVVQRRADLVYNRISQQMKENNQEAAKQSISSIIFFLSSSLKKGFYDRDPNIRTNCGFIGNQPILIDIGKLSKEKRLDDQLFFSQELKRATGPFKEWLHVNHPSLEKHFDHEIRICGDDL